MKQGSTYLSVPLALTGQKMTYCVPIFSPSEDAGRLLDVEFRTFKKGPEPKYPELLPACVGVIPCCTADRGSVAGGGGVLKPCCSRLCPSDALLTCPG